MIEFTLHPQVYSTGQRKGLIHLLERAWVREHQLGDGELCVVSGFGNYNGGVRFYDTFKNHIGAGGTATAILGGSTAQRLTSRQVVTELLTCGVQVRIINRKRILHAKCYGSSTSTGDVLVVSSGNFTGPGMSQNIESSVFMDRETTRQMKFSWQDMIRSMLAQNWSIHSPQLSDLNDPAWNLLYDEMGGTIPLDESEDITLLVTLSDADTARIQAVSGTTEGLGSQYFWLSKDCFDFFPPLTIPNQRGTKATYSCLIRMFYADLQKFDLNCRVTFEAENNFDFRLGTGPLRYSRVASRGDLAAISRTGAYNYELRIYPQGGPLFSVLEPFATNFIGNRGKRYGFISNDRFEKFTGVTFLPQGAFANA